MEIKFNQVMAKSGDLFHQEQRAKKLFNRLVREKNRLLDTLTALNDSDKLPIGLRISQQEQDRSIDHDNNFTNLSLDIDHYFQLLDEAYEFSSDEESRPPQRNPMSLIEWMKRNQPHVLTEQVEEKPAKQKRKSGTSAESKSRKRKNSTTATAAESHEEDEDEGPHKKLKHQEVYQQ
jgi:hypothetical protein